MGDYTITVHDPAIDTDGDIAETVAFGNRLQDEQLPGEPPTPVEQAIAAVRATPERMRQWSWRARDANANLVGDVGHHHRPGARREP